MDRRQFVAGSAAAALAGSSAYAQDAYPSRPITLINPFPPGGAADVVGRPFAAVLEPIIKQPVVIDTKAGAAGAVGAQFAANAKPDGYTLLVHIVSISGFAEMDKLFGRQPKFTRADFIPIARFTEGPMVLVVNDQTPYKTLKDLVDDAKKRPNEIIFSSSGLYGALHLPTGAVPESRRPADAPSADQRRRAGADRDPRQQLAGAGHVDRRGQCPDQGRQASRAGLLLREARGLAARRADDEGARLRRRVLALGRPVRAQGHAGRDRRQAARRNPRRPPTPTSSRRRSTTSATSSPISTSPNSPNSGTRTPSASRPRSRPSARCEDDRTPGR